MQNFSPRRSLPSRRKIVSLLFSFLSAVVAFGLGIGVVYATVTISENIQIGSGTPDLTLDGDDLYVTGTAEIDGDLAAKTGSAATFVVAASDASTRMKNQADFVADGTDDHETIQAAIDALPSGGGKVVLSEGTFSIGDAVSLADNTYMQGAGLGATILEATSALADDTDQGLFTARGTSGSKFTHSMIRDLKIDMNALTVDPAAPQAILFEWVLYPTVERVWITNTPNYGIDVRQAAERVQTNNNLLTNIGQGEERGYGIRVQAHTDKGETTVEQVIVHGNVMDTIGFNPIAIYGNSRYASVVGNVISGGPNAHGGIALSVGERVVISGNVVRDITKGTEQCIEVQGTTGHGSNPDFSRDVAITGNYIENCNDGINLRRSSGTGVNKWVVIANNVLNDIDNEGIRVLESEDVIVNGNVLHDVHRVGIRLDDEAKRVTVSNNHIRTVTSNSGIQVTDSEDVSVIGNRIHDVPGKRGIHVAASKNLKISDNVITGTDDEGIILGGITGYAQISGNVVHDVDQHGIHYTGGTVDDLMVTDNLIMRVGLETNNTYDSIHLAGSLSEAFVSGNKTIPSATGNIERSALNISDVNVSDALVENNDFRGSYGTATVVDNGTDTVIRRNPGFVTENSGTATIANGSTTVTVSHGLDVKPTAKDCAVTATNDLGTATKFWSDTFGASDFVINVDADPGAATATFAWSCQAL